MIAKPVYFTRQGLKDLEERLVHLRDEKRPQILRRLQESKGGGDWMDSSEVMPLEEELALMDRRIQNLLHMLDYAELIEPEYENDKVDVGERVIVEGSDGTVERYTIAGIAEADPGRGLISNESPLGQALLSHKIGEEVVVHAPIGEIRYRIVGFEPE